MMKLSETVGATSVSAERDEEELKRLIAEQAADDTDQVRPEYHGVQGGRGGVAVLSLDGLADAGYDAAYLEPGFAEVEDRLSDEPRIISHTEAQRALVREAVAGLTAFQQEVYYHVFGQGLSIRETADAMREDRNKIDRTIREVKKRVAEALAKSEDTDEGTRS